MSILGEARYIAYKILPLKKYIKLTYRMFYHRKLNLENPQFLSEKIYWLKLYYAKEQKALIQECYDKLSVREYVVKKGCGKYLTKLYHVYSEADEIDFNELPNSFVLKVTQSSGYNLMCKDKYEVSENEVKNQLGVWLRAAREGSNKRYKEESFVFDRQRIKIIAEEYLRNNDGTIVEDVKLFCINGKVEFFYATKDSVDESGRKKANYIINVYDKNWNLLLFDWCHYRHSEAEIIKKPDKLDEMILIAEKLSQDFPFVRVDLYYTGKKIYFGELTWIPSGGNCFISGGIAAEWDRKWGEMLKLPQIESNLL